MLSHLTMSGDDFFKYFISIASAPASKFGEVKPGSLWEQKGEHVSKDLICLQSLDFKDATILLPKKSVQGVKVISLIPFLQAIPEKNFAARLDILHDKTWIDELINLKVGDLVKVIKHEKYRGTIQGRVQYIGKLQEFPGTWFGIELLGEFHGQGFNNGRSPEGRRRFMCQDRCGIFVAVDNLRLERKEYSHLENTASRNVSQESDPYIVVAYGLPLPKGSVVRKHEDVFVQYPENKVIHAKLTGHDIKKIKYPDIVPYLLSVANPDERVDIVQYNDLMQEILDIGDGDIVEVFHQALPRGVYAKVCYVGELEKHEGIVFGLRLTEQFRRGGTTDGTHKGKLLFDCGGENSGIFVTMEQIRLETRIVLYKEWLHPSDSASISMKGVGKSITEIPVKVYKGSKKNASSKQDFYIAKFDSNCFQLKKGTLWSAVETCEVSFNEIVLQSLEDENVVAVTKDYVELLDHQAANYLLPVPPAKRLEIVRNSRLLREIMSFDIGTIVDIVGDEPSRFPVVGKIAYMGNLRDKNGTYFGVVLSQNQKGQGSTDGFHGAEKLFTCEKDSGLFVTVDQMRQSANPSQYQDWYLPLSGTDEHFSPESSNATASRASQIHSTSIKWIPDHSPTVERTYASVAATSKSSHVSNDEEVYTGNFSRMARSISCDLDDRNLPMDSVVYPGSGGTILTANATLSLPPNTDVQLQGHGNPLGISPVPEPTSKDLKVGDRCILRRTRESGTVLFIGEIKNKEGIHVGLELDKPDGVPNAGFINGRRYFDCKPKFGLVVPQNDVKKCTEVDTRNSIADKLGTKEATRKVKKLFSAASSVVKDKMTPKSAKQEVPFFVGDRVVHFFQKNTYHPGTVRWVGALPNLDNCFIHVGIEFDDPIGTSDGTLGNKRYFNTMPNRAAFVPAPLVMKETELQLKENTKVLGLSSPRVTGRDVGQSEHENEDHLRKVLTPGTRVVHLGESGPHLATLKWVGKLPGTRSSQLFAGIDYDEPGLGKGTGVHKYTRLFDAKENHACLLPVDYLISKEDFFDEKQKLKTALPNPKSEKDISVEKRYIRVTDRELSTNMLPMINSLVEIPKMRGSHVVGHLRWVGTPCIDDGAWVAGVECLSPVKGGTGGVFLGKKYFTCAPNSALFVKVQDICPYGDTEDRVFSDELFGYVESPDIPGFVGHVDLENNLEKVCGRYKGIQGHHNSCYMDATLFAMFFSTDVFDSILLKPDHSKFEAHEQVQKVLREGIVNPLRQGHYVRADKVVHLRELLEKYGSVRGLTHEEKDPEEFLTSLLGDTLHVDPFIMLSSGQSTYMYQLFSEKDVQYNFPTVQQVLEQSFHHSDIKLSDVPKVFILQMPRFGKAYKLYSHIIPSLSLDITDILEHSYRQCAICGNQANYECRDCFKDFGESISQITFCPECVTRAHLKMRKDHRPKKLKKIDPKTLPIRLQVEDDQRRICMQLKAVICIETSHYVAFVRCGLAPNSSWIFFDSMSDRKGDVSGYNIPIVKECPELSALFENVPKIASVLAETPKTELPEAMRRVVCDGYMCIYENKEVMSESCA